MFKAHGDKVGVSTTLHQLGMLDYIQGDYGSSRKYHEESLEMFKTLGNKVGISTSLLRLGMLDQAEGDYNSARKNYEESMIISKILQDRSGIAFNYTLTALLEELEGNYDTSFDLISKAENLFVQLNSHYADKARKDRERIERKKNESRING